MLKREGDNLNLSSSNSPSSRFYLNNEDTNSQDANIFYKENQQQQQKKPDEFNMRNYFLMHKVLSKLMQCKYAWPFKNAVSEEDAPDYSKIIEVNKAF